MTEVIAHRGANRRARENTVDAFRLAVGLGVDGIELDARRTADGVIVVHHDAHLDDGRAVVETMRRDLPGHVPTLGEALDACAGVRVNVEIKNAGAEPDFDPLDRVAVEVLAELAEQGPGAGPWLVSSFRLETVDRCHALDPGLPTAWLVTLLEETTVATAADHGHVALNSWERDLTAADIERCHAAGLAVNAWTVNDPARAIELVEWGADGIISDVPDVILGALGR